MYRIGELAERTGVSRPTLRYYEDIGLLEASARSAAGYRLYDSAAERRLQFIARAKRMGLSLDEIADLLRIWVGGDCLATREELRHLVAHKIAEVRGQVEELVAFERQLEAVYDQITEDVASNACGDACGCVPELPHLRKATLNNELRLIESSDCTCGGSCGTSGCSCGCACCDGNAQRR